jgi:hypothetical protein
MLPAITNIIQRNILYINLFLVNGLYIPLFFIFHYFLYQKFLLTTFISLKLYSANYFYWYNHLYRYNNIPKDINWIKQFIRFTDTGHIVSFIYLACPSILPIAFNTHFIITSMYWIGKFFFEMKDCDSINDAFILKPVEYFFCYCNHSIPLLIFTYEITKSEYAIFNVTSLLYSYCWIIGWFAFIYTPWRYLTEDPVYTILHINTPNKDKIYFVLLTGGMYLLSNMVGNTISSFYTSEYLK